MRRNHIRAQRVLICKSSRIRVSTSMTVKKHTSRNRFRAHRSPEFEDRFVDLEQNHLSSPIQQIQQQQQQKTERFFFCRLLLYPTMALKYGRLLRCFVCFFFLFFFSYFFVSVPGATANFFFSIKQNFCWQINFFLSELAPNVDEWCDFVLQKRMNKDNILQKLKNDMRCTQQTKINLSSTGNILICRFSCWNMRVGRWWISFWIPIRFTVNCAPTQQSEYTVIWLCRWNVKGVSEWEWIVWAEPVDCMCAVRMCGTMHRSEVYAVLLLCLTGIDFPRAKRELFFGGAHATLLYSLWKFYISCLPHISIYTYVYMAWIKIRINLYMYSYFIW